MRVEPGTAPVAGMQKILPNSSMCRGSRLYMLRLAWYAIRFAGIRDVVRYWLGRCVSRVVIKGVGEEWW